MSLAEPTLDPPEQKPDAGKSKTVSRWRRPLVLLGELVALALILIIMAGTVLSVRLLSGPLTFDGLNQIVVELMESGFDNNLHVSVESTLLSKDESGIKLNVRGVSIADAQNQPVLSIPEAVLTIDGLSLLSFHPRPRSMDFIGLSLSLTLYKEGHVALSLAAQKEQAVPDHVVPDHAVPDQLTQSPSAETQPDLISPLELTSLIDAVFDTKSVFGLLQFAHIHNGMIRIEDQRSNHVLVYENTDLSFDRSQANKTTITLSATGPKGPWSAKAQMRGEQGKDRQLSVAFKDLAISEILGFAEPGLLPVSTDMPLTFDVELAMNANGSIASLNGDIKGGKARLIIHDPDATPIEINELKGKFKKSDNGQALVFTDLLLSGDAMRWQGKGQINFPQSADEPWRYGFEGDQSHLSLTTLKENAIKIDQWSIAGELGAHFDYISFQPLIAKGPGTNIRLGGTIGHHPDFEGLSLTIRAGDMAARDILAFWPSFVASSARTYLVRRLQSGQVGKFDLDIHFDPSQLKASFNNQSIADDAMLIKASLTEGQLQADEGLPLLTNLNGSVRVTGKEAHVYIDKGELASKRPRKLSVTDAHYYITDTAQAPSLARVSFKLKGAADALIEALQAPGLSHITHVDFTPDQIHGQADLNVNIVWPQIAKPSAADIKTEAQGSFANFSIDRVFGKERLDNGEMKLLLDGNGFSLKGDAKIAGAPTQVNYLHKSGFSKPAIQLLMHLDEPARTRLGLKWGGQLQGPINAKIAIPADAATQGSVVEADLTKATINGLLPGWQKSANKAAKLSLKIFALPDDTYALKDINLDGGAPVQVRGEAEMSPEGALVQGHFPVFRISTNDEMRVDFERVGQITKVQIRATQMDLRPYLKQELSASGGSSGSMGDLEIDLKAGALTGYLNQSMQQADLRLSNRSGEIRDFRLSAKFEQQLVSGQMGKGDNGQTALLIESGNAGDLLRFLDLYRRMQGGRILLQIAPGGESRAGVIIVNDFILKDDPALAGVAQIKYPSLQQPLESGSVNFTKLRAQFVLGGGKFIVSDAVMWGPSIGGTLEGTIDYAADKSDLTGVFVPLYGLNNMLTQIPVLGPFLLGGTSGGIFGINFRVSGTANNPTVSINPLSAVAPGIFRKLFLFGVGKPFDGPDTKPAPPVPPAPVQPTPKAP